MTLAQAWQLFKIATAPTPPIVERAKRAWGDVNAARELLELALPKAGASPTEPATGR